MDNNDYPNFSMEYKNRVKTRKKFSLFSKKKKNIVTPSRGLKYTEASDVVYIIGKGDCSDSHVIIPEYIDEKPVSSIIAYSFMASDNLINIEIPGSVRYIGMMAFARCSGLETVVIQNGLSSIEQYAFSSCSNLKRIFLPKSITCIGHGAFYNCTSLMEIRFNGTKEEWYALEKGINWNINTPDHIIFCSNGIIQK